jgi:hypothetical protein
MRSERTSAQQARSRRRARLGDALRWPPMQVELAAAGARGADVLDVLPAFTTGMNHSVATGQVGGRIEIRSAGRFTCAGARPWLSSVCRSRSHRGRKPTSPARGNARRRSVDSGTASAPPNRYERRCGCSHCPQFVPNPRTWVQPACKSPDLSELLARSGAPTSISGFDADPVAWRARSPMERPAVPAAS